MNKGDVIKMIVNENIETKEECLDLIQRLMKQFGISLVKQSGSNNLGSFITRMALINDKQRLETFFTSTKAWNSAKFPSMYVNPAGAWNGITNSLQGNTQNYYYGGRFANNTAQENTTSKRDKSATNWPGYYHPQDGSGIVAWVPVIEIEEV